MAAISKLFATILYDDDSLEIISVDIDGNMLKQIVSFAHTGKIEMNENNVIEYAKIAFDWEMDILLDACERIFCDKLSIRNCIEWFTFAVENDMRGELRQKALKMIRMEFENISSLRLNLIKLDFAMFKEIIASDEHSVKDEAIFDRLVEWIECDEMARSKYVSKLLGCVCLEHISTEVSSIQLNFNQNRYRNVLNSNLKLVSAGSDQKGRCVLQEVRPQ